MGTTIMKKVAISLLISLALLHSCKKDEPTITDSKEQGNSHVLGYYVDSSFIGTYKLLGSNIGEFYDVPPFHWDYYSVSYQNRYVDFQQNGLMISYTLNSVGTITAADTLIFSNSDPAVSPPRLHTFNYQPVVDSLGNTLYLSAYPLSDYFVTTFGDTIIQELYNADNYTQIDTFLFVPQ